MDRVNQIPPVCFSAPKVQTTSLKSKDSTIKTGISDKRHRQSRLVQPSPMARNKAPHRTSRVQLKYELQSETLGLSMSISGWASTAWRHQRETTARPRTTPESASIRLTSPVALVEPDLRTVEIDGDIADGCGFAPNER